MLSKTLSLPIAERNDAAAPTGKRQRFLGAAKPGLCLAALLAVPPLAAPLPAAATDSLHARGGDPDLRLLMSPAPILPDPGDPITVTLTAEHLSGGTATGVVVRNDFDAELIYESHSGCTGSAQYLESARRFVWTIGNMTSGASLACTIETRIAPFAVSVSNSASIAANEPDANAGNNQAAFVTAVVLKVDLAMELETVPAARSGEQIEITLREQNLANDTASDADVTLTVDPIGLSFQSTAGCDGNVDWSAGTGVLTWVPDANVLGGTLGDLPPGTIAVCNLEFTVIASAGTTITLLAAAPTNASELDVTDNSVGAFINVAEDEFVVDSTADMPDSNVGDGICHNATLGKCTLRAAVMEANAVPGLDQIMLPDLGPYVLDFDMGDEQSRSDLDITDDVFILGTGPGRSQIHGWTGQAETDRIFEIGSDLAVAISRVRLTGGDAVAGGALIIGDDSRLELSDCELDHNTATNDGGAIFSVGELAMIGCYLHDNSAGARGGAISTTLGLAQIAASTFAANDAEDGGAIAHNAGDLRIANTTISGNEALVAGGGLWISSAELQVASSTIVFNEAGPDNDMAGEGGGLWVSGNSTAAMRNTLLHGNLAQVEVIAPPARRKSPFEGIGLQIPKGANCFGTVISEGYNLIQPLFDNDCNLTIVAGDLISLAPQLGDLADNGGLVPTHELLAESLGVDGGNPQGCTADIEREGMVSTLTLLTDARGETRHAGATGGAGARCDVGAYERDAVIFADGFESGDSTEWSSTTP